MVREHGEHRHTQANTTHKYESDTEHSSHRHTQTITERAETQRAKTQRDADRETQTESGFDIARSPALSSLTGPPISPTCLPKRQSA